VTAPGATTTHWERLHPLTPLVRGGRTAAALVAFLAFTSLRHEQGEGAHVAIDLALVGVALVLGLVHWLVTRWSFDGETLHVETGLLRRDARKVPVARIQAVDVLEPFVAKFLDVAELRLRVAGTGKEERLAYLHKDRALALRAALLATHHGLDAATPEPAERPLVTVPGPRLASSVLLSASTVLLLAIVSAGVTLFVVDERVGAALAATGLLAWVLGLATAVWRRFNGQYGFTLAHAPDGIRVRRGLVGTVEETIPQRRVQAVRQVEPLLWRPFGWRHLQVDLAGVVARDSSGGPRGLTKTLLPVGAAPLARSVLAILVDDRTVPLTKPPARVRLKSPLGFHNLAAGHDETLAVAVTGRLRRVTCWVPLEKVQSIRRVQGPVQRALGVATVHLDVAGRRTEAAFVDRDVAEADALVTSISALSRAARERARAADPGA
jgi:putative membrane protein